MLNFLASNQLARLAILTILFALVTALVLMISRLGKRRSEVRSAVQSIGRNSGSGASVNLRQAKDNAWVALTERIEKTGLSLADTKVDTLRDKLRLAGYSSPVAPKIFTLVRLVLVFALPLAYLVLASLGGKDLSGFSLYIYGGVLAILGLYLPNLYVTAKADRRREEITNGFPDCLDLLLVCVEAGLGLEAAMDRVGREMVGSHPLVSSLLSTATLQLRAGSQRDEALRRMGENSGVDEIRSFATLLIQSDKLGTSIGDTLRVYASEMRERRRMRAEEKAHRLPVLMSIPLVVCMLPTMVGVLMLPGVVRIVRELIPVLTSH